MPMFNAADFAADLAPDFAHEHILSSATASAAAWSPLAETYRSLGAAAKIPPTAGLEAVLGASTAWEGTVGQWMKPTRDVVASMVLPSTRAVMDAVRSTAVDTVHATLAKSMVTLPPLLPSARDTVMDTIHASMAKSMVRLPPLVPSAADVLGPLLLDQQQRVSDLVQSLMPKWDWLAAAGLNVAGLFGAGTVRKFAGRLFRVVGQVKDALLRGDLEPARRFVARHLRLSPTADRVQSLAVALLDDAWLDEVDLEDDAAVRSLLRHLTNHGNERESYHVIGGQRILQLPEIWTPGSSRDGDPEAEVFARVLAREDQFDDPRVPRALARLKTDGDRAVAYTWAEHGGGDWGVAALLAEQPEQRGEYTRRALRRAGALMRERDRARASATRERRAKGA